MKKQELLSKIAETTGLNQKQVDAVINAFSDTVLDVISTEDSVKFGEVCTFKGFTKPARKARNPRTGETIDVPAHPGSPKAVFTKIAKE